MDLHVARIYTNCTSCSYTTGDTALATRFATSMPHFLPQAPPKWIMSALALHSVVNVCSSHTTNAYQCNCMWLFM
jgi:hypothetical protein